VASLELARCHGRARPALAARYLCLASSSRGILDMKSLYLEVEGLAHMADLASILFWRAAHMSDLASILFGGQHTWLI
jgi:hypothetical protein